MTTVESKEQGYCQFRATSEFLPKQGFVRRCRIGLEDSECTQEKAEECGRVTRRAVMTQRDTTVKKRNQRVTKVS